MEVEHFQTAKLPIKQNKGTERVKLMNSKIMDLALFATTTFFISVIFQVRATPHSSAFCCAQQILSKCKRSVNLLVGAGDLKGDLEAIELLRLLLKDRLGVKESDCFTSRLGSADGEFDVNRPIFEGGALTLANEQSQIANGIPLITLDIQSKADSILQTCGSSKQRPVTDLGNIYS
jgi:hypothetical protein